MLEQLEQATKITINGAIVYYINVDTHDGEIPDECWEDWD